MKYLVLIAMLIAFAFIVAGRVSKKKDGVPTTVLEKICMGIVVMCGFILTGIETFISGGF